MHSVEFSFKTRELALRRFREETFDLLVIGGGITGAGVARDAVSRGLKVALVERSDFAWGTSSRSSKLIHGGLRYLENFELSLVFEALSERAFLLRTVPHMVRPLQFYLPVYQGDRNSRGILAMGLWLYDLLTLFRTPGFHKGLSRKELMETIPFLKSEGLQGGFRYFDASMWDDVLAVETLRSAQGSGAAITNYVEAIAPLWSGDRVSGFRIRDRERRPGEGEIDLKAHRVVVCAGPWTDQVGMSLSSQWKTWLSPSKGVHILFDLKKLPVPGAMVMSHPEDGRIAFVIPRPDFGAGVTIVGTTDGPTPKNPESAEIEPSDIEYLFSLLNRYFPTLDLKPSDILSGYVGVRPLMRSDGEQSLQKVSREHHIDLGPGGTIMVAGGKYTTHRTMAQEIVDFALKTWKNDLKEGKSPPIPAGIGPSRTLVPVNPQATNEAIERSKNEAVQRGLQVPKELYDRYGAEALEVAEIQREAVKPLSVQTSGKERGDPEGFPMLAAQFRYCIRTGMVVHLEDFYLRRLPLYAARADHGMPWAELLSHVWAEELGKSEAEARHELELLKTEVSKRSAWTKQLK